ILPRDANGISAVTSEFVRAAGDSHHFGHPMAAAIDRVYPLHAEHPRPTRYRTRHGSDSFQPRTPLPDHRFGLSQSIRRLAQFAQIVEYLFERLWRQPKNFRMGG